MKIVIALACVLAVPIIAQADSRFQVELRHGKCGKFCQDPELDITQYVLMDRVTKFEYPFAISGDAPERLLFPIPSSSTYTCIQNGDYAYVQTIKPSPDPLSVRVLK